jgi:hypothetical protein
VIAGSTETWFSKDIDKYAEEILVKCETKTDQRLSGILHMMEEDTSEELSPKARRAARAGIAAEE